MLIRHCDACGKRAEESGYYRLEVYNFTSDNQPKHINLDLCSECYNVVLDVLSYRSPSLSSNIDRVAGRPTTLEKIFKEEKLGIPNS